MIFEYLQFANLQFAGLALASTSFITIAVGHFLVRRLHPKLGTRLGVPFMIIGVAILIFSLFIENNLASGLLGIIAITTFWDGIEFFRQEKRVQRGHV